MMRNIVLLAALSLVGCGTFEAPKKFDAIEYNYSVLSSVSATRAIHLCGDVDHQTEFKQFASELNTHTLTLAEYEAHHSSNKEASASINQLRNLVNSFIVQGTYSEQYCKHKLSSIQSASRTIAISLSDSEKIDLCLEDVTSRYQLYAASYQLKKITKNEFMDLVEDIKRLQAIDKNSCSIEATKVLDKRIQEISKAATLLLAL